MNIGQKFLLFALVGLFCGNIANAQCTPNPIFASSGVPGIFVDIPDLSLPNGFVGLPYNERLTVAVVSDTPLDLADALGIPGLPSLPAVPVNHLTMNGATGIPPGLAAICDSSDCTWDPGKMGCIGVTGTPTTPGDYTMVFDLVMNVQIPELPSPFEAFGNIPLDLPILLGTTHNMTVGTVGVEDELDANRFSMTQNVPNPVSTSARIEFSVPASQEVTFALINLHGAVVFSEAIAASTGVNAISLDVSSLSEGVYFYRLSNDQESLLKKLVVVK